MSEAGLGEGAEERVPPVLGLHGITRVFRQGETSIEVLRGASLAVAPGEMVALLGQSGAGKSTLLQIAGLLERPDGGEVVIGGAPCGRLSDDQRTQIRRDRLGFVYQYHHLLPEFSALENVVLPQMIAGIRKREARDRAAKLLDVLGLTPRIAHRPSRLSGGEQQRVAIARALANAPSVLLADEPTGNLDHNTADKVFDELLQIVHGAKIGALVATHNLALAARMDRVLKLEGGVIMQA